MKSSLTMLWSAVQLVERIAVRSIFVAMVALYAFNVGVREIAPQYASSFAWIEELARYMMVWGVFLCLGVTFDRGRHIAMTTVLDAMPARVKRTIRFVTDFLGLLVFGYFGYLAVQLTLFVKQTGQISPTLGLAVYPLYIAPALGFFLLAFRYGLEMFGVSYRHGQGVEVDRETPS